LNALNALNDLYDLKRLEPLEPLKPLEPSSLPHIILNNHFLLTGGRTLFWEEEKTLILSDLHVGKSGHFRKHGIGVPQQVLIDDLYRLTHQVQYFRPHSIIITGDLFHSKENTEHDLFLKWLRELPETNIRLVMGNHDILDHSYYSGMGIDTYQHILEVGHFAFVHDMSSLTAPPEKYLFSGHLHPGITLSGQGRQSVHLPCFHFTPNYAVLPAFGSFTGTFTIRPAAGDQVYVLVDNKVIEVGEKV